MVVDGMLVTRSSTASAVAASSDIGSCAGWPSEDKKCLQDLWAVREMAPNPEKRGWPDELAAVRH